MQDDDDDLIAMTPPNPYLISALYEWIIINKKTPCVVIDAKIMEAGIPEEYFQDDELILNISPHAIRRLKISSKTFACDAQFARITRHIEVPIKAIKAIYARENGIGMSFSQEEYQRYTLDPAALSAKPKLALVTPPQGTTKKTPLKSSAPKAKPHLTLIKGGKQDDKHKN